jgi:hypothetical protein
MSVELSRRWGSCRLLLLWLCQAKEVAEVVAGGPNKGGSTTTLTAMD